MHLQELKTHFVRTVPIFSACRPVFYLFFVSRAGVDEGGTGGPGAGMQERARRWRRAEARDILTKSIAEAGGGARGMIATAHHRDDQAETVLLKALRGAHITKMQARNCRDIGGVAPNVLVLGFLRMLFFGIPSPWFALVQPARRKVPPEKCRNAQSLTVVLSRWEYRWRNISECSCNTL